jgi:hypothetical protein
VQDKETGEIRSESVTLTLDEGNRASTTLEGLSSLRPVLADGTVSAHSSITAGNSSQLSDGASASVLMEAGEAERRGLAPLGIYRGMAVAGCAPDEMGIGPVFAITFVGLTIFGFASGITDVAMNVSGAANERVLGRAIMPIFHAFFSIGTMAGAGLGALAELAGIPVFVHLSAIGAVVVVAMLFVVRYLQSEHIVEEGVEPVADDDHSKTWQGRLAI